MGARESTMNICLIVVDYTESCCLKKYEKPEWKCTMSAVRAIAERIGNLVALFRGSNLGPVVWIRPCPWVPGRVHPNIQALYEQNPNARFYSDGTGSTTFYKVQPLAGEPVFEKNLYSAFSGTAGRLDAYLREGAIERLVICGVYSTGCVNATVCEAFHHGYRLTIVRDCVETFDDEYKQRFQRHLLKDWELMCGQVVETEGLPKVLAV
jgi:nicotinamidase-related amidase